MNIVLISIKPEYVKKIFDGEKKYEYRTLLASKNISKLIVYSTKPEMRIVGEVEVMGKIEKAPSTLWEITKYESGITREKYREYFKGRKKACAYVLGKAKKYDSNKKLYDIGVKQAPQSYIYLTHKQYEILIGK